MKVESENFKILSPEDWRDYELVDSGNGSKLERFGQYYLNRPENQALWQPSLSERDWEIAHAILQKAPGRRGEWQVKREMDEKWPISYNQLQFWVRMTRFGHLGVFPEQAVNWQWIEEQIKKSNKQLKVLNLFGYTGIATLSAARAGSLVTHLDASKAAVTWAVENQQLSHLETKPIRWIIDDAIKFVKREARRGTKYDAIIMDPPKFGRGPKGEIWRLEDSIANLIKSCGEILGYDPQFMVITTYDVPISPITLGNLLSELPGIDNQAECGELTLRENASKRLLSTSIYARWSKQ